MAAYARTPSALTWLRVNHLINGLHKQISWKNCLYADNLYFTLVVLIVDLYLNMCYGLCSLRNGVNLTIACFVLHLSIPAF